MIVELEVNHRRAEGMRADFFKYVEDGDFQMVIGMKVYQNTDPS